MPEIDSNPGEDIRPTWTPMQIAEHRLFTAKEKLDLLSKIKAELRHSVLSSAELGFEPSEVDAAIEAVRLGAQSSERVRTVVWGDN